MYQYIIILYKVFTLKICKVFRANMLYFNVDKKLIEIIQKLLIITAQYQ